MRVLVYLLIISNIIIHVNGQTIASSVIPPKSWQPAKRLYREVDLGDINWITLLSSTCSGSGFSPTFNFGFFGNYVGGIKYLYTPAVFVIGQLLQIDIVWHADLKFPISENGTLSLTADAGLVLRDEDGRTVWSGINSVGLVKSMNMTCSGNLIIFGGKGEILWQSFDHPIDTWFSGQTLSFGTTLRSKVSNVNLSMGSYYLTIQQYEADAYFVDETNHSTVYGFLYTSRFSRVVIDPGQWSFDDHLKRNGSRITYNESSVNITYLRLDDDGHLNLYAYSSDKMGKGNASLIQSVLWVDGGECGYPLTCGNYGVCFSNGKECRCPQEDDPKENYFKLVDDNQSNLGCTPITPLSCPVPNGAEHIFIELVNVTSYAFESSLFGVDIERCKEVCRQNCSCKAAIFRYQGDTSLSNCSLMSQVYTLKPLGYPTPYIPSDAEYRTSTFLKVQRSEQTTSSSQSSLLRILIPSLSVSIFIIFVFIGAWYYMMFVRKKEKYENHSELIIDSVARFSFESIRIATHEFKNKLGRGGFGSVFEGTLEDGTKVAVKRLDSVGQGTKEFLAEVNSIGTLHHYNLVKLIGYCDEGSNRLLVYEFMPNGSLDKWIFNQDFAQKLTWAMRQRIVVGIAKGLEYLHENCLQNVIHFDIKPQNILLDREFNVKIADFGLAKMVDRDQSQVMTMIRGTPGYMAPELITAQVISVKVDVYSFGVLVLEIVCGRRNIGSSYGDILTDLMKVKADEGRLSDLIDERIEDMEEHREAAIKMMKIGIWCLQPHFIRPNMSMVVKVLHDLPDMEVLSDLSYLTMVHETTTRESDPTFSTRPTESILSGPR